MSLRLAAGWARSRSHGVSVVPITQKSSLQGHGMMNSRLFSVSVISPVSESIRSLGMITWTPLEAVTLNWPLPPTICWMSSVHTPAALTVVFALTSMSLPVSRSLTTAPITRWPSRRNEVTRALVTTSAS
jgi:hypothetical protein